MSELTIETELTEREQLIAIESALGGTQCHNPSHCKDHNAHDGNAYGLWFVSDLPPMCPNCMERFARNAIGAELDLEARWVYFTDPKDVTRGMGGLSRVTTVKNIVADPPGPDIFNARYL